MANGPKGRGCVVADWTPSIVEARLADAAWVLKRMPEPRMSGYFSTWPEFVHSFADKVDQEPANQHWLFGLSVISLRLNNRRFNRNLSKQDVIKLAGAA